MSNNLKTLISKLNDNCRRAAERAASICMAKSHFEVDIEHLFLALLEQPRSDFTLLCQRSDVSPTALSRDLENELARFKEFRLEDAEIILISYGSSARSALHVVEERRQRGERLGLRQPSGLKGGPPGWAAHRLAMQRRVAAGRKPRSAAGAAPAGDRRRL